VSSIVSGLIHLSGWVALTVIGALVFGETAVFLGFVLPGETAAVIGGVLASRGHLSLPALAAVVVAAAVIGPVVGYEIGRRTGDRLLAARSLGRIAGGLQRATSVLRARGGLAVFLGRFVAFLRAVMPAAAGAARVPYRTFLFYNVAGGLIWGVGYCLLGYAAGSAYSAIESRVGAGLAIAVAAIVVAGLAVWAVRRHRRAASGAGPGEVPPADLPSADLRPADLPTADVPPGGAAPDGETAGGEPAETAVSETVIGETAGAVPASGPTPPAGDESPLR